MDSYIEAQYKPDNNNNIGNGKQHDGEVEVEVEEDEHHTHPGLLRFRSAPSSLFFEYTQNNEYEVKPERLLSGYSNSNSGSNTGHLMMMSQLPPQYPKQVATSIGIGIGMEKSLELIREGGNLISNNGGGGGGRLNLNRQTSSPPGFFSQLNNNNHTQNGYTVMKGLGSFRVANGSNGESSPRTGSRLGLGVNHLPRIPEIGNENIKETSPDEDKFRTHDADLGFNTPSSGYPFTSWNDPPPDASLLSENGGALNRPTMLTHHLSLPKTSTEMAAIEKLLHFQDTVPCKVRAKRGCATHPRSIAERERRNRISERMRKLQELVPNMDKQTNISDMLDLAVDYVKSLQDEFKMLSDGRARCKCVNLQ